MLWTTRKRDPLDRSTSLAGIPVFNDGASICEQEDGRVVIRLPPPPRPGLLGRLLRPVPGKQLRLDELGSFVVRQIDGETNVSRIIESFVAQYRTNRREAELSMVEFLKSLARRRVISILIQ